jgi:hypothetical protein
LAASTSVLYPSPVTTPGFNVLLLMFIPSVKILLHSSVFFMH